MRYTHYRGLAQVTKWVRLKFATMNLKNGYYTLYAHCSELIAVEGSEVKQGEVIAKIGCTGNATGNHLHFELIFGYESEQGGLSIDPYNAVAP